MLLFTNYATIVASAFCSGVAAVIDKGGAVIKANFHAL
jgi:hypothetical protein